VLNDITQSILRFSIGNSFLHFMVQCHLCQTQAPFAPYNVRQLLDKIMLRFTLRMMLLAQAVEQLIVSLFIFHGNTVYFDRTA
jgi:hypothetical protein